MSNEYIDSLADFLKPAIVSKDITHNGKTTKFYFRELSGEEGTNIFSGFTSENQDKKEEAMRALRNKSVAASVCDADGNAVATEKQVAKWPLALLNELHTAVMDHNGLGKKDENEPKN